MRDDPLRADPPTPGAAPRRVGRELGPELVRVRRDLARLSAPGVRPPHPHALHRAEAVTACIVGHGRDLAGVELAVDRRAGVVVAAAALRRRAARGAVRGDAAWIGLELGTLPVPGPRLSGSVSKDSRLARQLRRAWSLRTAEGATLGEAVAAARSGRPIDGGVDAPSR